MLGSNLIVYGLIAFMVALLDIVSMVLREVILRHYRRKQEYV